MVFETAAATPPRTASRVVGPVCQITCESTCYLHQQQTGTRDEEYAASSGMSIHFASTSLDVNAVSSRTAVMNSVREICPSPFASIASNRARSSFSSETKAERSTNMLKRGHPSEQLLAPGGAPVQAPAESRLLRRSHRQRPQRRHSPSSWPGRDQHLQPSRG